MGLVRFEEQDAQNLVAGAYSTGRGQVLRSEKVELTKIRFRKGFGAEVHQHPEEQILYILEGRAEATVGQETFEVRAGEGVFNPSNVPHSFSAKEDTVALSFKQLVAPGYEATGSLT